MTPSTLTSLMNRAAEAFQPSSIKTPSDDIIHDLIDQNTVSQPSSSEEPDTLDSFGFKDKLPNRITARPALPTKIFETFEDHLSSANDFERAINTLVQLMAYFRGRQSNLEERFHVFKSATRFSPEYYSELKNLKADLRHECMRCHHSLTILTSIYGINPSSMDYTIPKKFGVIPIPFDENKKAHEAYTALKETHTTLSEMRIQLEQIQKLRKSTLEQTIRTIENQWFLPKFIRSHFIDKIKTELSLLPSR